MPCLGESGSWSNETDLYALASLKELDTLVFEGPTTAQSKGKIMSLDALPPSLVASRSLLSFVQVLETYDPQEGLYEGHEETKGFEVELVIKFLRAIRGFLTSARGRIIEAHPPNFKEQLAVLSGPIQQLSDHIFSLERGDRRTPAELRSFLTDKIRVLLQSRKQITELASELQTIG
jgi:hypothetical protein